MTIIAETLEQGKILFSRVSMRHLRVLIVLLAILVAFGLGVLAGLDIEQEQVRRSGFWIEDTRTASSTVAVPSPLPSKKPDPVYGAAGVGFVASKSGKKYYLPTCSGVGRIKEENRVWYATALDAQNAGLTPAANCPGL